MTYFKVLVPVRMTDIEKFRLEDRIIKQKVRKASNFPGHTNLML